MMRKNNPSTQLPTKVSLVEVGPRDGFQFETHILSTDFKVALIRGLADAGLKQIQIVSFVNPDRVPQMADADQLVKQVGRIPGVIFSALVLNLKGLERAKTADIDAVEISVSASNAHSRRNTGMSNRVALNAAVEMIRQGRETGMKVRAGIQCAFGCAYEGEIPQERILRMIDSFMEAGADMLALADTTGMATPPKIKNLLLQVLSRSGKIPVVMHLHDTRGLGLVNLMAALEMGIAFFDTALGGMGGCPFVPNAAGNISTEDTAYLLSSLNISTGIDIGKVSAWSHKMEAVTGKALPGKYHRLWEDKETDATNFPT